MDRLNLSRKRDRLALVRRVFSYPEVPHVRVHGPAGFKTYEAYRDWLRDEFSFRCVFSLVRERWVGRAANFDIDHLHPQSQRQDLVCDYENLLYVSHRVNLVRGPKPLPDPCRVALGRCLSVDPETGSITALSIEGRQIIETLRLDNEDATSFRLLWLRILRSVAETDEETFRQLVGYPTDLPDFQNIRCSNTRPEGLAKCAWTRRKLGTLPEWY